MPPSTGWPELNVMRFLKEDMPQLVMQFASGEAMEHFRSMSASILELLKREGITFNVSDEMVGSIIHILYLSVQNAPGAHLLRRGPPRAGAGRLRPHRGLEGLRALPIAQ